MTRTALVTGGTGFLGTRVAAQLTAAGWDVHRLGRPLDRAAIAAAIDTHDPDAVVSLAVQRPAPDATPAELVAARAVNVDAPRAIGEHLAARGRGALVLASSYVRDTTRGIDSPLAEHRRALAHVAADLHAAGVPTTTLVPTSVYGPSDPRPKLLPALVHAAAAGTPVDLSAPTRRLDLVHVDDAAAAFARAAHLLTRPGALAPGTTWDVRTGRVVTLAQLVALVEHAAGTTIHARWNAHPPRPHDHLRLDAPPRPLPGWHAATTLEQGLAAMVTPT